MLTWQELEQGRPAADSHYFEFLAGRAAWITYEGDGQTSIRWRLDADGEKHLYRQGI